MTDKVQFVVTSEGWQDSFEDVSPLCLPLACNFLASYLYVCESMLLSLTYTDNFKKKFASS